MELRKCRESREIALRNTNLRQSERSFSFSRGTKVFSLEQEKKRIAIDAVSQLSPAQKRRWDSFPQAKQEQLLKQVGHQIERRMRYQDLKPLPQKRKRKKREASLEHYRQGKWEAGLSAETVPEAAYRNTALSWEDAFWKEDTNGEIQVRERIDRSKEETSGKKPEPDKALIRFKGQRKRERSGRRFTEAKAKAGRDSLSKGEPSQGMIPSDHPMEQNQGSAAQMAMRTEELAKIYLFSQRDQGTQGDPQTARSSQRSDQATYSQRRFSSEDGKIRKPASERKKEQKVFEKKTGLYRKELGRIIEQETRREAGIRQQQREQQVVYTINQAEAQMRHQAGLVVTVPGKLIFAPVKVRLAALKGKAARTLIRYAALAGVPLLLLFFLCQVMVFSISGLMAEEETIYGAAGQEIVEYAKQWIGVTRYILGAGRKDATDWQDYTDCSGFVHGVFAHFGYEIGGYTGTQQDAGTLVAINSLDGAVPGDIVLFYKNGVVERKNHEHVAIYAGEGRMIHCAGGAANYSVETAGPGVIWGTVAGDGRPWMVRRIVDENFSGSVGASGGYRKDPSAYSQAQIELIWAIVAQEDNGSYEGALAVISSAMNRSESPTWSYCGSNALEQLTAPGQYCYSNDTYWQARLNGNVPQYVKQAVSDCLDKGIRNHRYTSFRSQKGSTTGPDAVQIGGNWFFGS